MILPFLWEAWSIHAWTNPLIVGSSQMNGFMKSMETHSPKNDSKTSRLFFTGKNYHINFAQSWHIGPCLDVYKTYKTHRYADLPYTFLIPNFFWSKFQCLTQINWLVNPPIPTNHLDGWETRQLTHDMSGSYSNDQNGYFGQISWEYMIPSMIYWRIIHLWTVGSLIFDGFQPWASVASASVRGALRAAPRALVGARNAPATPAMPVILTASESGKQNQTTWIGGCWDANQCAFCLRLERLCRYFDSFGRCSCTVSTGFKIWWSRMDASSGFKASGWLGVSAIPWSFNRVAIRVESPWCCTCRINICAHPKSPQFSHFNNTSWLERTRKHLDTQMIVWCIVLVRYFCLFGFMFIPANERLILHAWWDSNMCWVIFPLWLVP